MASEPPDDLWDASEDQPGEGTRESRTWCEHIRHYGDKDDYTWGFSIYRTVYRPGSDEQFATAINIIDQWVRYRVYFETQPWTGEPEFEDPIPNDQVWQRYRNEVVQDPELEGASIETIAERHRARAERLGRVVEECSRDRFAIIIDRKILDRLLQSPPMGPGIKEPEDSNRFAVIAVDVEGSCLNPPRYEGWAWTPIAYLPDLWFDGRDCSGEEWQRQGIFDGQRAPMFGQATITLH